MKTTKNHPKGLGRGSNPNSRKNLQLPKTLWIVLELKRGQWTRFASPTTQRKAYLIVRDGNEAIRTGGIRGVRCYAAIADNSTIKQDL